jgi:hypothetical protein
MSLSCCRSPTPPSRCLTHPYPHLASVPPCHPDIPSRCCSLTSVHLSDERAFPCPLLCCMLPHHPDIPSCCRSSIPSPSHRLTIPVIRTTWPGTPLVLSLTHLTVMLPRPPWYPHHIADPCPCLSFVPPHHPTSPHASTLASPLPLMLSLTHTAITQAHKRTSTSPLPSPQAPLVPIYHLFRGYFTHILVVAIINKFISQKKAVTILRGQEMIWRWSRTLKTRNRSIPRCP